MDVNYGVSGNIQWERVCPRLLHGMLAIAFQPRCSSQPCSQSIAVIVTVLEYSGFPHLDRAIKTVRMRRLTRHSPRFGTLGDTLEIVRTLQFRP